MSKKVIKPANRKILNTLSSFRSRGLITSQHFTSLRGQVVNSPEEVERFIANVERKVPSVPKTASPKKTRDSIWSPELLRFAPEEIKPRIPMGIRVIAPPEKR